MPILQPSSHHPGACWGEHSSSQNMLDPATAAALPVSYSLLMSHSFHRAAESYGPDITASEQTIELCSCRYRCLLRVAAAMQLHTCIAPAAFQLQVHSCCSVQLQVHTLRKLDQLQLCTARIRWPHYTEKTAGPSLPTNEPLFAHLKLVRIRCFHGLAMCSITSAETTHKTAPGFEREV